MSDQEYERFRLAMGKPIVKMQRGHPTPRFKKLVQWVAILSEGEADACIRDYRSGQDYCCEAVNHFGGPTAVIERAVQMRRVLRDWGEDMKPSPYWRRYLTKQRMYCNYCYCEGTRTRLGGPEILSVDGMTLERFGTARYNRILRYNTIKHLRDAHGITH